MGQEIISLRNIFFISALIKIRSTTKTTFAAKVSLFFFNTTAYFLTLHGVLTIQYYTAIKQFEILSINNEKWQQVVCCQVLFQEKLQRQLLFLRKCVQMQYPKDLDPPVPLLHGK